MRLLPLLLAFFATSASAGDWFYSRDLEPGTGAPGWEADIDAVRAAPGMPTPPNLALWQHRGALVAGMSAELGRVPCCAPVLVQFDSQPAVPLAVKRADPEGFDSVLFERPAWFASEAAKARRIVLTWPDGASVVFEASAPLIGPPAAVAAR